jgi:hypothetical protein
MDFTPEELELLAGAVNGYIGEYEGAVPDLELASFHALAAKIAQLLLVGKKVLFTNDLGQQEIGVLRGFRKERGKTLAEITTPGYLNLVDPDTELHGEA